MKKQILLHLFLAYLCFNCAKTSTDTTTTATVTNTCAYANVPSAYPSTYDFTALPSGFTHSATTDQIIASGGVGVLQSVTSEKLDIMYGPTTLTTANRKLKIDFAFTGAANINNNVTLYSNDIAGANTYYHAQISKAGALSVIKLSNGSTVLSNYKIISPAPAAGTLEFAVCNGNIFATVGSDSISVTDSSLISGGRIGFLINQSTGGTAGSVSVDNFGVFVP